MDRKSGSMTVMLVLTTAFLVSGATVSYADEDPTGTTAVQLPGLAEPDTVRTNLWLAEALMGEIVSHAAGFVPAPPGSILLVGKKSDDQNELFGNVAAGILRKSGYDLFLASDDSTEIGPVDYIFTYTVVGVELTYPDVGRTLGIWERWVGREVAVTASVEITGAPGGQLLFKEIVQRTFSDRVDSGDFDRVESDLYPFTTAQKTGSGWQNRIEEIIVLGTLVGLIAVYFANTGS
jgi:hypothetical protein